MRTAVRLLLVILLISLVPVPTFAQDSDDICATTIVPLVVQAGLEAASSAVVFGCAQEDTASWHMRPVQSLQDEQFQGQLSLQGQELLRLVDSMSMDRAFLGTVQFDRSTSTLFTVGAGGVMSPTDISEQAVGAAPNWLNNYVDGYTQAMQVYLTRTAGQVASLVEYMQWFMARRDATLTSMAVNMNPMVGTAFLANWSYQQFPWFWQLADQEAIRAYAGSGSVETPVVPDASSEDANLRPVFSPSLLSVEPGENAEMAISLPRTSFGGSFTLVVSIPAEIRMIGVPVCRLSDTCADISLDIQVVDNPDGSTQVTMSGLLYAEPAELGLDVKVLEGTANGTTLFLMAELFFGSHSAPSAGPETNTLQVLVGKSGTGSNISDEGQITPSPMTDTLSNTMLSLSPIKLQARAGDTVTLDIRHARLQGIDSLAFMASSEDAWIENLPRYLVDEIGNAACSAGYVDDIVPPDQRAVALEAPGDFPPTRLELIISSEAQPGDDLTVCVEMIGFSGTTELFAWNAQASIEVRA